MRAHAPFKDSFYVKIDPATLHRFYTAHKIMFHRLKMIYEQAMAMQDELEASCCAFVTLLANLIVLGKPLSKSKNQIPHRPRQN